MTQTQRHQHADCPACRDEHYEQAKADPVASIVLNAMHAQDAVTYNGISADMGQARARRGLKDPRRAIGRF